MINLRKFHVIFGTNCSKLVNMVLDLEKWYAFATYLEEISADPRKFATLEITHISRTENTRADSLHEVLANNRLISSSWTKSPLFS